MKKPPKDLVASIQAKLQNVSRTRHAEHLQVLIQFAIERFLYRLSLSPFRDRFLLKGAMLFVAWDSEPFRPTRDVDLLGFGELSTASARQIFEEIASLDAPDDALKFQLDTLKVEDIRAFEEYVGYRVTMKASLGKTIIPLQVDVGIGDAVVPTPAEIQFPSLLGLPSPILKAYKVETVVAEKLQAIARHGMLNTRMKDYFDLYFFATHFHFEGKGLTAAIRATFERRGELQSDMPLVGLSSSFSEDDVKRTQWRAFLNKNRLASSAADLTSVVELLAQFLSPPLTAALSHKDFILNWEASGPWGN